MATTIICGVLLRSLLVALFRTVSAPEPIVLAKPSSSEPVADRAGTLSTQFTAGVRGSRAPPVASA